MTLITPKPLVSRYQSKCNRSLYGLATSSLVSQVCELFMLRCKVFFMSKNAYIKKHLEIALVNQQGIIFCLLRLSGRSCFLHLEASVKKIENNTKSSEKGSRKIKNIQYYISIISYCVTSLTGTKALLAPILLSLCTTTLFTKRQQTVLSPAVTNIPVSHDVRTCLSEL